MRAGRLILCWIFLFSILAIAPSGKIAWANTTKQMVSGTKSDDEIFEAIEDDSKFTTEIDIDLSSFADKQDGNTFYSIDGFLRQNIDYSFTKSESENKNYPKNDYYKVRSTINLNADFSAFDNWKATINLNGFYDAAYQIIGRDKFSEDILKRYESEVEIRDMFFFIPFNEWLTFKMGRQVIAWGESENIQITDMVNPRDFVEPGLADLEDSRIPVFASKFSIIKNMWEFNIVAISELRGNKDPAFGSEFDPWLPFADAGIEVKDTQNPESNLQNTEFVARLFKSLNGGDVSITWADTYDDLATTDFFKLSVGSEGPKLTVVPRYKRIKTFGCAGNWVTGAWLFKAEIGQKQDRAFLRDDLEAQIVNVMDLISSGTITYDDPFTEDSQLIKTWSRKNLSQIAIGVEYIGVENTSIAFELSEEKIADYEENLLDKEINRLASLSISYTALNQTLVSRLFWYHFTENNGDIARFSIGYDLIDAFNLTIGVIYYEATDKEASVYPYRHNDRFFSALKYSF